MARRRLNLLTIVTKAAEIVDVDGPAELSLGRLAADLGVSPSALYNHVDGIDALLHELAVHSTQQLAKTLRDALVAKSGAEAIAAMAVAYRSFAQHHAGQYESTLSPAGDRSPDLAAAQMQIAELFSLLMHSIGLEADEADHVARIVRSTIHGFVSLESIDAMTNPIDRDHSFERLTDMLLGMAVPAASR